jgi:hypothetical protein
MTPRIFFPGRLLRAMGHAESFCIYLSRLDGRAFDVTSRAWLLGRRQEVACFIDRVGRDYRTEKLDEMAAMACIDAYLGALHAGVAMHFGERQPPCCRAYLAVTRVPPRPTDNTPTTLYVPPGRLEAPRCPPRPDPPRRRRQPATDDGATWIDVEPDQLLAGLKERHR